MFLNPLRNTSLFRSAARLSTSEQLGHRSWSSNAYRPWSSSGNARSRTMGINVMKRPFTMTAVTASLFGFMTNPREILGTSEAGSILREASPAAPTKQPYTLVFVSAEPLNVKRSHWQSWIMYFREAGYDCIDLSVELPKELPEGTTAEQQLSREIAGQMRLASLQRQPVIFLRDEEQKLVPSYLGKGGLFARRGPMSGLVLLHPKGAESIQEADWPSNTPILIVPKSSNDTQAWAEITASARNAKVLEDEWNEKEGTIKEVERWMRYAGL